MAACIEAREARCRVGDGIKCLELSVVSGDVSTGSKILWYRTLFQMALTKLFQSEEIHIDDMRRRGTAVRRLATTNRLAEFSDE